MASQTVDSLASSGWQRRMSQAGAYVGARAGLLIVGGGILLWFLPWTWPGALNAVNLTLPLLVILAIVLARAVSNSPRRRLAEVEEKYERAAQALREVSQRHLTMLEVKSRLEQRIVGQPESVVTLYEIAKKLETLEPDGVYGGLLAVIGKFLGATSCSIYLEEKGQLQLRLGWPSEHVDRPIELSTEIPLVGVAFHTRRVATIRDHPDTEGRAGPGPTLMMAGPLLGDDKSPLGVVVVERIPFLNLTPAAVRLFELILDWASTALQHAQRYEEARGRAVDDGLTGICTAAYTTRRLRQELQRSHDHQLPLALIVVQIDEIASVAPKMLDVLVRALGAIFQSQLRTIDIVGHLADRGSFGLILPMTSIVDAWCLAERINVEIGQCKLHPYADHRPISLQYGFAAIDWDSVDARRADVAIGPEKFLAQARGQLEPLRT